MMGYRKRHTIFSGLVFIAALIYVVATQSGWIKDTAKTVQQSDPGLYSIDHYVDGDTIAVNMNGSIETIRFIGVDTPETHKPNTPVQCYGPEAAAYTRWTPIATATTGCCDTSTCPMGHCRTSSLLKTATVSPI
jgi:hypothetical protein